MTKSEREARKRVRAWCEQRGIKIMRPLRHVHPLAYVVGKAAPKCLIVARPWTSSEPQCEVFDRENHLTTVHEFDEKLGVLGENWWCTTAYVVTPNWSGTVAVPL